MSGYSEHVLEATVDVVTKEGQEHTVTVKGIPVTWVWGDISRDAVEMWAVLDYIYDHFQFESFSVVSISSSAAKKH